jgi:hypothetical protein
VTRTDKQATRKRSKHTHTHSKMDPEQETAEQRMNEELENWFVGGNSGCLTSKQGGVMRVEQVTAFLREQQKLCFVDNKELHRRVRLLGSQVTDHNTLVDNWIARVKEENDRDGFVLCDNKLPFMETFKCNGPGCVANRSTEKNIRQHVSKECKLGGVSYTKAKCQRLIRGKGPHVVKTRLEMEHLKKERLAGFGDGYFSDIAASDKKRNADNYDIPETGAVGLILKRSVDQLMGDANDCPSNDTLINCFGLAIKYANAHPGLLKASVHMLGKYETNSAVMAPALKKQLSEKGGKDFQTLQRRQSKQVYAQDFSDFLAFYFVTFEPDVEAWYVKFVKYMVEGSDSCVKDELLKVYSACHDWLGHDDNAEVPDTIVDALHSLCMALYGKVVNMDKGSLLCCVRYVQLRARYAGLKWQRKRKAEDASKVDATASKHQTVVVIRAETVGGGWNNSSDSTQSATQVVLMGGNETGTSTSTAKVAEAVAASPVVASASASASAVAVTEASPFSEEAPYDYSNRTQSQGSLENFEFGLSPYNRSELFIGSNRTNAEANFDDMGGGMDFGERVDDGGSGSNFVCNVDADGRSIMGMLGSQDEAAAQTSESHHEEYKQEEEKEEEEEEEEEQEQQEEEEQEEEAAVTGEPIDHGMDIVVFGESITHGCAKQKKWARYDR